MLCCVLQVVSDDVDFILSNIASATDDSILLMLQHHQRTRALALQDNEVSLLKHLLAVDPAERYTMAQVSSALTLMVQNLSATQSERSIDRMQAIIAQGFEQAAKGVKLTGSKIDGIGVAAAAGAAQAGALGASLQSQQSDAGSTLGDVQEQLRMARAEMAELRVAAARAPASQDSTTLTDVREQLRLAQVEVTELLAAAARAQVEMAEMRAAAARALAELGEARVGAARAQALEQEIGRLRAALAPAQPEVRTPPTTSPPPQVGVAAAPAADSAAPPARVRGVDESACCVVD